MTRIYLVPGEPYFPGDEVDPEPHPRSRRQRALGLTALLAVAAVAIGIQHSRTSHLPAPVAAPAAPPVTADTTQYQPWPQGIGVCGVKLDLPQISSDVVAEPTHARVPVAGALPALVDVDTGRRADIPGLRLRSDQYASAVVRTGGVSYVLVHNCQRRWMASVVRAQAGRPQQVVSSDRTVFGLIGDDAGAVWAEAYTGPTKVSPAAALGTTLVRMDRPAPAVELPVSLNVIGISGNQVAAAAIGTSPSGPRDQLYRYDLTTRRATLLGTAYSVTESRGKVLWTSTPCSAMGACALRSIDLHTGRTRPPGLPPAARLRRHRWCAEPGRPQACLCAATGNPGSLLPVRLAAEPGGPGGAGSDHRGAGAGAGAGTAARHRPELHLVLPRRSLADRHLGGRRLGRYLLLAVRDEPAAADAAADDARLAGHSPRSRSARSNRAVQPAEFSEDLPLSPR